MRLSAAAAGHVTLLIGGKSDLAILAVRLAPAEDDPVPVPFACAIDTNPFASWIGLPDWDAPKPSPETQAAIGRWLAPHNDWAAVGTES